MKRFCKRLDDVLLWAAPAALVFLMEGFARGGVGAVIAWIGQAPLFFLLALGLAAGACFLVRIFSSLRVRFFLLGLLGLLASLIGIACRCKMLYRMEPILFSDLSQLRDAAQAMRSLPLSINFGLIAWLCALFGAAMLGALFVNVQKKRGWRAAALGAALIAVLPGLCTFEASSGVTRYDLADHARHEGMLYTALAVENQRRAHMNADISEEAVRGAWRTLAHAAPEAAGEPSNVIVVLSESFTSDAWLARHLALTRPVTPFYDQLSASCQSGFLTVPKAGGGTSETEFEVLTGLQSRYGSNPYAMGLPPVHSLASALRGRGLHASAIHWHEGVYYNRYHNLKQLGFDEFSTLDTLRSAPEKTGMFTSDRAHYEAALEQLARTEERDFLFVITMQNHGGYDYADFRLTHGADEPFSGIADEAVRRTLANYCFLLSESDRALEDFIRDLQACPEPVTLVFFGDHIPPLGEDAYAQLGLSTADPDCFLAPYLIWHNRGNEPTRLDLEAWQLGAQALLHAGAGDDPFFAHIEALRQSGNKTDESYDLISRDVLFGKQHAYAEAGLSPANDHFRIGGEMTLSGFDAVRIADAIYLRPKLKRPNQRFRLRLNGALTDIPCVSADADELTLQCVLTRWDGLVWNQSATLAYTGAQQLLSLSDSLPMRTLPAPACELFEKKGGLQIYRSLEPLPECFFAVVTSGEERFGWQPSYGLTQPRQYALDADGHLLIALSQQDTPLLGQLSLHLLGE